MIGVVVLLRWRLEWCQVAATVDVSWRRVWSVLLVAIACFAAAVGVSWRRVRSVLLAAATTTVAAVAAVTPRDAISVTRRVMLLQGASVTRCHGVG